MKVVGFTIIKNAIKMDYPVMEAITSILPICDEFIVSIGDCTDGTLELIENIQSNKIHIVRSVWGENKQGVQGKHMLAIETNKALEEISADVDWAFYIQSDEVVHEKYLATVKEEMVKWKDDSTVDCLVLKYKHFYGSYDYIGASLKWYRREIRIFKPQNDVYSYRDAQSFRKGNNKKLNGKLLEAYIYHYGWVRPPKAMVEKYNEMTGFYTDKFEEISDFAYNAEVNALYRFNGTHPQVMKERLKTYKWEFNYDVSKNHFSFKDRFKMFIEKLTGWRIGEFKCYRLV